MELTRLLYDQYKYERENYKEDLQFDMIKRIEDYRRNINLYNSFGLPKSSTSIPSQGEIPLKSTWSFITVLASYFFIKVPSLAKAIAFAMGSLYNNGREDRWDKEYMIQILVEGSTSSFISIFLAASVSSLIFCFSYETVGDIGRMAFSRLGICTATSLIFRSHIFWKRDRPLLGCNYTACQS